MTAFIPLNLVEIDYSQFRTANGNLDALPSEGSYRFQVGDEIREFTGTYLQFVGHAKREAGLRGLRQVTLLP